MPANTSGYRRNDETQREYERRIIETEQRRSKPPRMELKVMAGNRLHDNIIRSIYPDSEYDAGGNLVVIKKSAPTPTDYIFLEVKGERFKFRFSGEGSMNFESDVLETTVEFYGFVLPESSR